MNAKSVAEAVGPIEPGCEIYGLSKGQFSLIDLVEHVLGYTGPAEVVVSTWTAAGSDIDFAFRLLKNGAIQSLRFLVDLSFPSRQPAYCAALRETFGDDCIRVTKNHAKFVLLRNAQWNVAIRTSMNLNENRRLENFEVSDDAQLADFLAGVVAELFETQDAQKTFKQRPAEHAADFERAFGAQELPDAEVMQQHAAEAARYLGSGPFDTDVRRSGISYL